MTTLRGDAPGVLQAYYRILGAGIEAYDPGGEFRTLLADGLEFEGPLAGKRTGAGGFCQGVKGFIANVSDIDVIQEVHGLDGSAILYDARMPGGTVRFAEFFSISDGKITALRLHYDAADYTQKGGR
ncbi:nuclear transport factor 2 family protein [Arthrobacter globiformis]|uniref:hypothetical protein n=1 Tax=Arthrobacter globiformis TaxID=1665 RepID=UPI00397D69BD